MACALRSDAFDSVAMNVLRSIVEQDRGQRQRLSHDLDGSDVGPAIWIPSRDVERVAFPVAQLADRADRQARALDCREQEMAVRGPGDGVRRVESIGGCPSKL